MICEIHDHIRPCKKGNSRKFGIHKFNNRIRYWQAHSRFSESFSLLEIALRLRLFWQANPTMVVLEQ